MEDRMTRFGTNIKLTIAADRRPRVRALFVDLFGATASSPRDALEVYTLADGGNVGVCYVDASETLSSEDQPKGAWLEFRVAEPAAVAARLLDAGIERLDYSDHDHDYFKIPGGPIFRLAAD
jgi:hypothetical protein